MNRGTVSSQKGQEYIQQHPGYSDYRVCQSKTFAYGTCSSIIAFSVCYFIQQGLKPYPHKVQIALSMCASVATGWYVTFVRSRTCLQLWEASEELSRRSVKADNVQARLD